MNDFINSPAHNFTAPAQNIRLAVCILHYGSVKTTAALHKQLLASDAMHQDSIFVLDNAAINPYPKAWRRLEKNIFWPGAFAYTLDAFAKRDYTHLWFCNNDITFLSAPPYVERMKQRIMWQEKIGPVGILSPSLTQNPYHAHMAQVEGAGCVEVPYADGVAPIVNLQAIQSIGGLDFEGNPYGYGVDVWLSLSLAKKGWRILVDHTVLVRHRYHTTAQSIDGFLDSAAEYENAYMKKRLGNDWQYELESLRNKFWKG